jgi:hypothetical protein
LVVQFERSLAKIATNYPTTLSFSIYLYIHTACHRKYLIRMMNFKFSLPRYPTGSSVIPQNCGIYQS